MSFSSALIAPIEGISSYFRGRFARLSSLIRARFAGRLSTASSLVSGASLSSSFLRFADICFSQ